MDCEWTIDDGCLGEDWATYDTDVQLRASTLAVDTLRRLTGFRVGGCPVTVRPVLQSDCCFIPSYDQPTGFGPGININGDWVNNCGNRRGHLANEVVLPPPVGRVDEVKVDGIVVASSNYRVDNGNHLTWQGVGNAPWPKDQDVTRPDSEEGTFAVTYLRGYPVDSSGAYAAGLLANEFAKACSGKKCRLPAGVQTIVRQGITMEITSGAFPGGLTGIREVDAWTALWNPRHAVQPTTVWSPDVPQMRSTP
jgi:hypothetical protein